MSTLRVNNVQEAGGAAVITSGVLDKGSLPTGSILQVVSTTKTDTFTSTSTTFSDITGLSVSITPQTTSSKILVLINYNIVVTGAGSASYIQFVRDSTAIGVGDAAGSRIRVTNGVFQLPDSMIAPGANFLDSPNTTSAVTYKVQCRNATGGTLYINRSVADTDSNQFSRAISTITAIEVAG